MRGTLPISWVYGNNTVWEEYIDISFTVANCAVLFFTSIVGIAANVFVTWAVYRQKSLRTWNNALLVNLAVIDILRCCIDCPILLTIVLKGPVGGGLEKLLCDAQVASFSFSCCIQLLTLACISMERHQAIAHPFKITQRRRRILVWIPLTWMVGVLVAAFCLTFVKDSPVYVRCRGEQVNVQLSYDTFGLYILVPLWSTCFAVITGFYARIFIIVRAHGQKMLDKGSFPATKQDTVKEATSKVQEVDEKDGKTKHDDSEKNEIEVERETDQREENRQRETVQQEPVERKLPRKDPEIGFTNTTTKNAQGAMKDSSDNISETKTLGSNSELLPSKVKLPRVSFAPQVDNPSAKVLKLVDLEQDKDVHSLHPNSIGDHDVKADDISPLPTKVEETVAAIPVPETETPAADQSLEVKGAVCMMPSFVNKEHANKKKESKLAKRSGYIILTFLIFWMPLIVMVMANFCNRNRNSGMGTAQDLEFLSVSVACMTSASNPITYAVVNPQFRTEFHYLRRKCQSLWTRA